MSTPPDPDDERRGVDPPSPDDRLWRHPSEIGAGVKAPAAWPALPRRRRRRDRTTILLGALAGACFAGGAVFLSMWAIRPTRPASQPTQAVAVRPVSTEASAAVLPTQRLAKELGPSLPGVRAQHDGIWTAGSGVWLDAKGTLLTAAPLVLGASKVVVTGQDDVPREAKVLGTDSATGISTLSVNRTSGTPLGVPAGPAQTGSPVVILGAPAAVEGAQSDDATTALATVRTASMRTSLATGVMHDAIQLDRAVPVDALGGVVVDADGRVIAIAIAADDGSGMGTGSPADWALSAGAELRAHGTVTRAWLGVEATDLDPGSATAVASRVGAQVISVTPGSPAEAAGIRVGDVVTAADDQRVEGATDLVLAVRRHQPGDRCTLTVRRDGSASTTEVTLGR